MTAQTPALEPPTGAGQAPAAQARTCAAGVPGCLFCGGAGVVYALAVTGGLVVGEDEPVACACVVVSRRPADRKVLGAVVVFWREHGYPPSVRDLAAMTGRAVSFVTAALTHLRADGLIDSRRGPGSGRTLRLVRR